MGSFFSTCSTCSVCGEANEYLEKSGGRFGRALEKGTMAVIKGSYFLDCLRQQKPFAHRAQIEAEAPSSIFKGEEAAKLWYRYGHEFLLVVSYCWLSKEHPDPKMFYLPYLKSVIEAMKYRYGIEVGIILDYTSFYQEPRTDDQQKSFKECLNLINVPYGHKDVTAVKFVTVPTEENRTYDDRGWTKFESDVIDSKPTASQHYGWLNVLSCSSSAETNLGTMSKCQRRPPVIPSRFRAEMEERRQRAVGKGVNLFTNGKDQAFLEEKYTETFAKMAESTTYLDFTDKNIGDTGVEQLSEALQYFEKLTHLNLHQNQITDAGVKSLAKALGAGGAPHLASLFLSTNNIGDGGARALAEALRGGAAPKLKWLYMEENNLTAEGKRLLKEVKAMDGREGLDIDL